MDFFLVSKCHAFPLKMKVEEWINSWSAEIQENLLPLLLPCYICGLFVCGLTLWVVFLKFFFIICYYYFYCCCIFVFLKPHPSYLSFITPISLDHYLSLGDKNSVVGSTLYLNILAIFESRSHCNISLGIGSYTVVNIEIAKECMSSDMDAFKPCSALVLCLFIDRNWALQYRNTISWLFSIARDVHAVCLLSCMLGMILGRSDIFPSRKIPAWAKGWCHSSVPLTWIQLAEDCTVKFCSQTQMVQVSLLSKGNSPIVGNVTKGLHTLQLQCADPMVITQLNECLGR